MSRSRANHPTPAEAEPPVAEPPVAEPPVAAFYERLAALVRDPSFTFMNYGLADPCEGYGWLLPGDESVRHHLALARRALDGVELEGRRVLEVGSGRGGNCAYLVRYASPAAVLGLDRCLPHVALSQRIHRHPRLAFLPGDAEALPFAAASFDVVLSLESAHCYPGFDAFLAGVHRVLAPGGVFCLADLWQLDAFPRDWARRERALGIGGFEVEHEEEITRGVARALAEPTTVQTLLAAAAPSAGKAFVGRVAEVTDGVRRALEQGRCRYRRWRLRRR